jgi:hypothetical protein
MEFAPEIMRGVRAGRERTNAAEQRPDSDDRSGETLPETQSNPTSRLNPASIPVQLVVTTYAKTTKILRGYRRDPFRPFRLVLVGACHRNHLRHHGRRWASSAMS